MKNNKPLILILCGGRSLRLWPLSKYKSKNFFDIFGFSPLELTIKRFLKITPKENIFLVANQSEKRALTKLKLVKEKNIFFEPESKNTASAVLYSLQFLKKYPKHTLIISPVDQFIKKDKKFLFILKTATDASKEGYICTLGIKPTQPTPNFGYIQIQKRMSNGAFAVKRFIEKPSPKLASKLIKGGNCFYNSGMFIATVETFDKEYKRHYPGYNYFVSSFRRKNIASCYKKIPDLPFDKAIMEKSKRICLVKADFPWLDFGNWQAIYEILPKDKLGNVKKADVSIHQAHNNFIYLDNPKKKVLLMGLKDVFFIDTANYSLLASRSFLNDLKSELKKFKKIA